MDWAGLRLSKPIAAATLSPTRLSRYAAVSRVLLRVLFLNLAVAVAKIAFGYASGAISILSDGFHSLTDAASNVVGLVGVRAARQPPDEDHPYGHRKYETVAAAAVIRVPAARRRRSRCATRSTTSPDGRRRLEISATGFVVMAGDGRRSTSSVVAYESREAERLGSEVLLADALQTRGDVWTSLTVIAALAGARCGLPILDPLAALVVAGFIGYAGYQIAARHHRHPERPDRDLRQPISSAS